MQLHSSVDNNLGQVFLSQAFMKQHVFAIQHVWIGGIAVAIVAVANSFMPLCTYTYICINTPNKNVIA